MLAVVLSRQGVGELPLRALDTRRVRLLGALTCRVALHLG